MEAQSIQREAQTSHTEAQTSHTGAQAGYREAPIGYRKAETDYTESQDMQSLYDQYRHTLQGLLDRRAQLAGELGETVRRVQLLDQEIDEVFEVLHLLRGYVS